MSKPDQVYDSVLIALDTSPRTAGELARIVSARIGREITVGSVLRALRRAREGGAAVNRAPEGKPGMWTEPDDDFSIGAA